MRGPLLLQCRAVLWAKKCEGQTQGHWSQAPGQHLLLLKVVGEQEPCSAHSGPLRRISLAWWMLWSMAFAVLVVWGQLAAHLFVKTSP